MRIDNKKNTYRIWLRRLIIAIIFTLAIVALILAPWFSNPDLWLTEYHVIIFIAVLYVAINIVNSGKRPNFVFYSDQGEMLIMRYYPLSLFNSKKHSIEIPKQQFVKYELKPFFFGREHKIVLYQHFRNKVVAYPPISLSALEEEDRTLIIASLQKYCRA